MILSIVIPHFNQPYLLEKLLASIPQDKKDIQTIVVDDKSESTHLNAVKQLKEKYNFEFYQNDKIKSAGICRNIGLEKANGKWILFADGDDNFVSGFYDKISKYFNSEKDVIFFSPKSQHINTGKVADRHLSIEKIIKDYLNLKSRKSELLLRYNFMAPWSKMINKKFMDIHNIKFNKEFGAEDVMFSTKIGYFMKHFEVSKDVIYCIILRYGSNSRIFNESLFDIRLNARISRIKFLNQNLSKKEKDELNSFIINKAAEFLLKSLSQFGLKKFLQVYILYKKNRIKWIHVNYFNPIKIVKYIAIEFIKYIQNNKYNKS